MKQGIYTVLSNVRIAPGVFCMEVEGDTGGFTAPGQFADIQLPGLYLRRPISICNVGEHTLTFVYKVVGKGTADMSEMEQGQQLDMLTGLGNGFDVEKAGDRPLLIGGGVGIPPLYWLAKRLTERGARVQVILGFNTDSEVFGAEWFRELGADVTVTTVDGSMGTKGFVTDAMEGLEYSFFYTCGPMPMFRAVERIAVGSGQYSFEQRMGCGFGACMGCSMMTRSGAKRVCKEGPVFDREDIIW